MTTTSFITKLQDDWKNILPEIKETAISSLTSDFTEINFLKARIDNVPNEFGIYLFQIFPLKQFDHIEFKNNWKSSSIPIHSPSISTSRFKFDIHEKWYPFYIGKAEKLSNRINEHCFQDFDKTTYGLKLKHRKELLSNAKFCYSYFKIADKKTFDKHAIQFVMTNLEREIRNEIKPWIGKQ